MSVCILLFCLIVIPSSLHAKEYINFKDIPDEVALKNIGRLANMIAQANTQLKKKPTIKATQLIGKEQIDEYHYEVWYCLESTLGKKTSSTCGGDISLIKLDTGRWIIRNKNIGAWLLVEE